MTEHILNFAISLDDETIVKNVQDKAEHRIIKDLEIAVLSKLFDAKYYGHNVVSIDYKTDMPKLDTRESIFNDAAMSLLLKCFENHKEEIINKAAELIADSYKRSKAFKEKVKEVIE